VGDPKKGAANRTDDVKTVQGLLNVQMVKDRRSDRFLAVDGRVGRETVEAIGQFQRRRSITETGLIQRGDATIRALASFSGPYSMRVSTNLIDWLKNIEKFDAIPYDDDPQHPLRTNATIGYGHKLHAGTVTKADLERWGRISTLQGEDILRQDLGGAENEVNDDVRVPLSQNQFDALVSLAFNTGQGDFRRSTLLRLLNHGDYEGAANEFPRWDHWGSDEVSSLRERRVEEQKRFRDR